MRGSHFFSLSQAFRPECVKHMPGHKLRGLPVLARDGVPVLDRIELPVKPALGAPAQLLQAVLKQEWRNVAEAHSVLLGLSDPRSAVAISIHSASSSSRATGRPARRYQ